MGARKTCSVCGQTGHNKRTHDRLARERTAEVIHLRAPQGGRGPYKTTSIVNEPPPTVYRGRLTNIRPPQLLRIENDLRDGRFELWSDLADTMVLDPHLAGLVETRIKGVSSADWTLQPADDSDLAQAAADFVRHAIDRMPSWGGLLERLLWADMVGIAVVEKIWETGAPPPGFNPMMRAHYCNPDPVPTRDLEFDHDWALRIKSYIQQGTSAYRWLRLPVLGAEPREDDGDLDGFIVHFGERAGQRPNFSGDLLTVTQCWLFKHWAEVYFNVVNERAGYPTIYAKMAQNAPSEAREAMLRNLANLRPGQALVTDEGVEELAYLESEMTKGGGEKQNDIIDRYNREMTKGLLGSTDNVESDGGSLARAVNQAKVSIYPRHYGDADRLRGTLQSQYVKSLLKYNVHLFGGRMPPVPLLKPILTADDPVEVPEHYMAAGVRITQNEARQSLGLDPIEGEVGDQPLAPGVAASGSPFAGLSLPPGARLRYGLPATRGNTSG